MRLWVGIEYWNQDTLLCASTVSNLFFYQININREVSAKTNFSLTMPKRISFVLARSLNQKRAIKNTCFPKRKSEIIGFYNGFCHHNLVENIPGVSKCNSLHSLVGHFFKGIENTTLWNFFLFRLCS